MCMFSFQSCALFFLSADALFAPALFDTQESAGWQLPEKIFLKNFSELPEEWSEYPREHAAYALL